MMTGSGNYMIIRSDNNECLSKELGECSWEHVHLYSEADADAKVLELDKEGDGMMKGVYVVSICHWA